MTRLVALLLMAGCAALVGCGEYKSAPVAPPAGPGQAGQPAGAQATAPAATTPGTEPASMPIELSTGVAMAQTLPEGTSMSFSVDYRVAKDAKVDPKAKYVWVIERSGGGTPIRKEIPLTPQGTLQIITPWHPEDGPFRSHIEDASGTKLSASIEMK